jgi:hypothetical protein
MNLIFSLTAASLMPPCCCPASALLPPCSHYGCILLPACQQPAATCLLPANLPSCCQPACHQPTASLLPACLPSCQHPASLPAHSDPARPLLQSCLTTSAGHSHLCPNSQVQVPAYYSPSSQPHPAAPTNYYTVFCALWGPAHTNLQVSK